MGHFHFEQLWICNSGSSSSSLLDRSGAFVTFCKVDQKVENLSENVRISDVFVRNDFKLLVLVRTSTIKNKKVASNEKKMGFIIPKIWQILKRFARQFHQ